MDDTYIHMAIAKNVALHGVWGVTRYAFTSSTSSPLYTLLLALAYLVTGIHEVTPLLLNLAAAAGLLLFIYFLLEREGCSAAEIFFTMTAVVLLTPLGAVAAGGMEHVLHALLTLVFVHFASLALSKGRTGEKAAVWLIVMSPVLVMARYEGVFLIFTVAVLFSIQRRWMTGIGMLAAAGAVLGAYGAWSMQHGWLPLPNSVLLKANVPHGSTQIPALVLLWNWAVAGVHAPHLAFLGLLAIVLLYLCFRRTKTLWDYATLALVQFAVICLLHLEFARTGWFYRYEAYLVAAGIVICAMGVHHLQPLAKSWVLRVGYVFALAAAGLLGFKSFRSIVYGPRAYHNVYEQQYQVARFVAEYYTAQTIVLNDIGAVCFFTDARVLDVYGLGSMEPARAKLRNDYNTAWLWRWASENNAALAIMYAGGWAGESFSIPSQWRRVAAWKLSDNFVLAGDTVGVYSLQPALLPGLESNIGSFRTQLPPEIEQLSE